MPSWVEQEDRVCSFSFKLTPLGLIRSLQLKRSILTMRPNRGQFLCRLLIKTVRCAPSIIGRAHISFLQNTHLAIFDSLYRLLSICLLLIRLIGVSLGLLHSRLKLVGIPLNQFQIIFSLNVPVFNIRINDLNAYDSL